MSAIPHPSRKNRYGAALVMVLGVLVLLLGLIVAFISRAGSERSSSSSYAAANSSRNLADLAVNLVQGQINDATTRGSDKAWASQPGAISVFSGNGNLETLYRLYSAESLTATTANATAADLPPSDWSSSTALWCDLNAPAIIPDASVPGGNRITFPILDPTAIGTASAPQGLAINAAPGATVDQPAPMPVRWLYVLKDGSLVAPTGSGTVVNVSGGSANNPITGRIAFWTDDDTCRVNVNTASEGSYWDTPRANTTQERNLANYQPAQNEFQRYPGHPATTSLSAVFPELTANQIYDIVPRIIGGGSNGGTAIASGVLAPDEDRLYANIGELLYTANRTQSPLDKAQLEQAKFVLTAQSRAPEVNLFNLPKVAIWPIFKDVSPTRTTPFDRLIAFCSTISARRYFFQRENADSATNDISIPDNLKLYNYLHTLTDKPIPGFGGNFASKYKDDRDQILTEIFDYIRSSNLYDDLLGNNSGNQFTEGRDPSNAKNPAVGHGWVIPTVYNKTMGFGRAFGISEVAIGFICRAAADDPGTVGTDESEGSNTNANPAIGPGGTPLAANEKIVQALLIPELFSVMQGWTAIRPDMEINVSGLKHLKLDNNSGNRTDLYPSDTATISYTGVAGGFYHGRHWGGNPAWRFAAKTDAGSVNPLISQSIRINTSSGSMVFTGGQLVFELRGKSSRQIYQRVAVELRSATFPIPRIASSGTADTNNPTTKENWWDLAQRIDNGSFNPGDPSARLKGAILREEFDVVRSVIPSHGDFRLICARFQPLTGSIASDLTFVKHPDYDDTTKRIACGLSHSSSTIYDLRNNPAVAPTDQRFFTDLTPSEYRIPDIPRNATVRPDATGDFDTGVSVTIDGPYINKPDEGNIYRKVDGTGIPYFDESFTQILGGATFFSPNRIMPSPGMFGSLPTGLKANIPWKTLLFRPQNTHPAHSTTIPDHLLMDFFWMPVVEPYAISEPFSTAGKINMNYQIQPFTYIERSTGMRAVLESEMLAAIPDARIADYKAATTANTFRLGIDAAETLKQFQRKFSDGQVFRSATEICDIHIIPTGTTLDATGSDADATMGSFWSTHRITGDNLRERIYTTLYPRLTTKSNSYTVYYTVQALANPPGADQTQWDESKGRIISEYRGSTSLERYIDPEDPNIPDYAAAENPTAEPTLDKFYRWRVTGTRQFAP